MADNSRDENCLDSADGELATSKQSDQTDSQDSTAVRGGVMNTESESPAPKGEKQTEKLLRKTRPGEGKTILELDGSSKVATVAQAKPCKDVEAESSQPSPSLRKTTPGESKTILEVEDDTKLSTGARSQQEGRLEEGKSASASSQSESGSALRKTKPGEARTNLDLDACREVASQKVAEQEVKLQEQAFRSAPSTDQIKPFIGIDNYRQATSCSASWQTMEGTERVRYCSKCKLQVYDFDSIELPEAESMIFKMEGKRNPTLFKKHDGKFLTSDCPVGVRTSQIRIMAVIGGAITIVALTIVAISMPHPPAPTRAEVRSENTNNTAGTTAIKATNSTPAQNTVSHQKPHFKVYMEGSETVPSPLVNTETPVAPVQTMPPAVDSNHEAQPGSLPSPAPPSSAPAGEAQYRPAASAPPSSAGPTGETPGPLPGPTNSQLDSSSPDSGGASSSSNKSPYVWQRQ
jgi:hypothetical protein